MADNIRTAPAETGRTLFASQTNGDQEQREEVDFKMVTFSLGGKDYGIDIMKVKEIAKFDDFTYVPNAQPFVAGVYNLRGDIISVIDMRIMFSLPAQQRTMGETEDGLILRLESGLIGVVVDHIDKVVGIASEAIQPPHPIFADINIKYISGVVEHDDRLYIILDAERVLGSGSQEELEEESSELPEGVAREPSSEVRRDRVAIAGQQADLIAETLRTLSGFHLTDLTRAWMQRRLEEWQRENESVSITTQAEVDEFLGSFYSPYSGRFWDGDYRQAFEAIMPKGVSGNLSVWNPGCGKGYEAYSIAATLRKLNPEAAIKIWAGDNDLLNVSTAPNLIVDPRGVPEFYEEFLVEGTSGYAFADSIRASILFEFSDVTHTTTIPPAEVIVMRDLMPFLSERDQLRIVGMIQEIANANTVIVVGKNEDLSALGEFVPVSESQIRAFRVG